MKRLQVKSLVTGWEKGQPSSTHFKDTTVLVDGKWVRSWATDDSDQVLFYRERSVGNLSAASKLFFSGDWADVSRSLKEMRIPILEEVRVPDKPEPSFGGDSSLGSVASVNQPDGKSMDRNSPEPEQEFLGRWKDSIAWVISKKPVDRFNSQLWIEKDTFLPVRLVVSQWATQDGYDLSFENYRRDFAFPRTLSLSRGDDGTVLKSQVLDISASLEGLKLERPTAAGFSSLGETSVPGLKKLIELYYGTLR
jgi:hypothetical protein